LQNKPKVKWLKINLSSFLTSKYEKMDNWLNEKTNPIQSQFWPKNQGGKPNQSQFWADFKGEQSQTKPK
jgi:hypothetical protein